MLNKPMPSSRHLLAGTTCVLALALACGYAAWAAQPARAVLAVPAGQLRLDATMRIDGGPPITATQFAATGQPFVLRQSVAGHDWEVTAHVTPAVAGMHTLDALIRRNGQTMGMPKLVMESGQPSRIQIGDDKSPIGGGFTGIELDVTIRGDGADAKGAISESDSGSVAPVRITAPTHGSVQDLAAPSYPREAMAQKIDGTVVLEIELDATGKVTAVSVVKSDPAGVFDAAAMEAAWKWRLDPFIEDGKPVPGRVHVPVRFEHDKAGSGGMAQT